ncbi:hypothetical protein MY11210_006464 [Beauveria gryllotalpidicola]
MATHLRTRLNFTQSRYRKSNQQSATGLKELLEYIMQGEQVKFDVAEKRLDNSTWLELAEAIVRHYLPTDYAGEPHHQGDEKGGGAVNHEQLHQSRQTQEEWLELLLKALPSGSPRNLADEVIHKMGHYPDQSHPISQEHWGQAQIFQCIIESNDILLDDARNSRKLTLAHNAAKAGACISLQVCVGVLQQRCRCRQANERYYGDGDEHDPSCVQLANLISAQDLDGHTPLYHAVAGSRAATVVYILKLSHSHLDACTIRQLINISIQNKNSQSEEIIRELLQIRKAGCGTGADESVGDGKGTLHLRKDVVEEDTLRYAVEYFEPNVFQLLLSLVSESTKLLGSNVLHYAVSINREEAAIMLLNEYPELAVRFQDPGINSPSTPDGDDAQKEGSVLACHTEKDINNPLRRRILEVLTERLPISQLREHLTGPSWVGKEISLDVSSLALQPSLLNFFVRVVKHELAVVHGKGRKLAESGSESKPETKPDAAQESKLDMAPGYSPVPTSNSTPNTTPNSKPVETQLQLADHAKTMTEYLTRSTDVEFEHVLKYVNIPCFEACRDEYDISGGEAPQIFEWLRSCKKVERVFQVRVDDSRFYPNSEEDIENALRSLDVRDFDWKRTDLSITSIRRVAENVETLFLYSSGSLATLDHCSPNYTLPLCEKLRPVEVTGLDNFLVAYSIIHEEKLDADQAAICRTKIAILDSGINRARFSFESHKVHGRSFVWTRIGALELEAAWWLATDPHGSQMANIIAQLDPQCELYIAQIADDMGFIEEGNVIRAFDWAIGNEVTIINCSFALHRESPELEKVVKRAKRMGIAIMCSTADDGENTEHVWPAAFYKDSNDVPDRFENVFPIVGCDEHGKPSVFASDRAGRFCFRGEDIDSSTTVDEDSKYLRESGIVQGSSVATAMATGIGSLVLSCYNISRVLGDLKLDAEGPGVLSAIFHHMKSTSVGVQGKQRHPLVTASKFFPVDANGLEDSDEFINEIYRLYAGALQRPT